MIVTNAGWNAVDAAACCARRDCRAGWRKACERSTASGREMLQRTAKSRGPDAPTLASSSRSQVGPTGLRQDISAGDGGKRARSPRRARRKPLKPLRAGTSGDSGVLVYSCAFYHYQVHARPRVQRASGVPHALFGRKIYQSLGRMARRGHEAVFSRHCEPTGRANARPMTGSAKQSILSLRRDGLLRCACNDGRVSMDCFAALAMTRSFDHRATLSVVIATRWLAMTIWLFDN